MGSKTRAREIMKEAGVPIVPGATKPRGRPRGGRASRPRKAGYPVGLQGGWAGGGRARASGSPRTPDELQDAFEGGGP